MNKLMYYCKCCDYFTDVHQSITKHVNTEKHINNAKNYKGGYVCDTENKVNIYTCKCCDKRFLALSTKKKHQKECIEEHENNNKSTQKEDILSETQQIQLTQPTISPEISLLITNLINEDRQDFMKIVNQLLQQQHELLQQQKENNKTHAEQMNIMQNSVNSAVKESNSTVKESLDTIKATVENNSNVTMKSMSLIKYASLNLRDAPPLETLKRKEIYGILGYKGNDKILTDKQKEEENEKFVKIVIGRYENKDLSKFLGETIVTYFKKQSTNDKNEFDIELSPLWSVDVARLCFIIMQPINKEGQKEWTNDKSGKLFTQMVTTPMLETLDKIIRTFLDYKIKWEKKVQYLTLAQMDYLVDIRQKCAEILNDIKYNKLIKPILREVAPCFQFNDYLKNGTKNWKLVSDKNNEHPNNNLDDSTDEVPKKINKKSVLKNKTIKKKQVESSK